MDGDRKLCYLYFLTFVNLKKIPMKKNIFLLIIPFLFATACSSTKKTAKNANKNSGINYDSIANASSNATAVQDTTVKEAFHNYHGSATIKNALRHTTLDVRFDWKQRYLYGKATITLKPYFYNTDSLILDAKGMNINSVELLKGSEKAPLKYTYDSIQLHIGLDKTYTRNDSFTVFIDYVSMPDKIKSASSGSMAITSHKGLFFINPDGKDSSKPRELWTQGETEDNSCWFPTIDKPDQRMTEDIFITADKQDRTLSNGALISSKNNNDGTHTDHWVMNLTIPPYLVTMAVGPFAVIHDTWRGKDVDYYIDSNYAQYARDIFGRTPQMIELFSNLLHFPYVWNKYDQVIVHDFVTGAMENCTATTHGDLIQKTRRELIDQPLDDQEDIISHELFHHWFGDLVTCESWSNISLNESFATYGEYLWREYKYGRDEADRLMQDNFKEYMGGGFGMGKDHDLVDFYYHDREDLFDLISYQKGGTILNMLRTVVGDSAFFNSLHLYLETYKFSPVEVPMLRMSFEKITGTDLNWFFNEWFYNKGYPALNISHQYDENTHVLTLKVDQTQDLTQNPVFKMPIRVNLYAGGKKYEHLVWIEKTKDTFAFNLPQRPQWVDFDTDKVLLCTKNEEMPVAERIFQYKNGNTYIDRYDALTHLATHIGDSAALAVLLAGTADKFWFLRRLAIDKLSADSVSPACKERFIALASDPYSLVRASAISALARLKDKSMMPYYEKALKDSSSAVIGEALAAVARIDSAKALGFAARLESTNDQGVILGICSIYARYGSDLNNNFFIGASKKMSGYQQIFFVATYGQFLQHCSNHTIDKGLDIMIKFNQNGDNAYVKYYAKYYLQQLQSALQDRSEGLQNKLNGIKAKNPADPQISQLQTQIDGCTALQKRINDAFGK